MRDYPKLAFYCSRTPWIANRLARQIDRDASPEMFDIMLDGLTGGWLSQNELDDLECDVREIWAAG